MAPLVPMLVKAVGSILVAYAVEKTMEWALDDEEPKDKDKKETEK